MAIGGNWEQQGRQEHDWFGHGTSVQPGETGQAGQSGEESVKKQAESIIHGVTGHLPAERRKAYESYLAHGGRLALTRILVAWAKSATSGRDDFRDRFLPPTASDRLAEHLRKVAGNVSGTGTEDKSRESITNLSMAVSIVGIDRFPRFIAEAHARTAIAAMSSEHAANLMVQKIQVPALLAPKPPFFLAEPPKGIIPRFMERIPRQSGKEAADDLPGWARGARRMVGETPRDFAKRVLDGRYGPGKWDGTGPGKEFNRIKKFGERAFRDPKELAPFAMDEIPEA